MIIRYETPDEHLSYSELKDRIREECGKNLPAKERIVVMAKKLEEDLTPKDRICGQICTDLCDVTSERWVRKCLPDEYKQQKKKRNKGTEQIAELSSANDDKNLPVQETITVDNQGYERPFDEMKRKDVEPASEIVKTLQKKIEDVTHERDSQSREVKILKEKTQPEMLKEIQERFYDEPGLINERSRLYRHKSSLYPTVEFERFLIESRESIMAVAGHFDMILTGLIIQTGSIEAARSLFFSAIIAEYLNLSESESSKRLQELVQYANALLQIDQHMEFLRDWK